jgi:hypothetical protein
MKTIYRFSCLAILAFIISIFFYPPYNSGAQEEKPEPKVKLTLLLLRERDACPPKGYVNYDREETSNCQPWGREDLPALEKKAKCKIQTEYIPPSKVRLGKGIYYFLDTYRTVDKSAAANRYALLLVFEWDRPQVGPITLKRTINREYADFPEMIWTGSLAQHSLWINHQRADAFLPGYKVEWTLKEGGYTWIFKTGRK